MEKEKSNRTRDAEYLAAYQEGYDTAIEESQTLIEVLKKQHQKEIQKIKYPFNVVRALIGEDVDLGKINLSAKSINEVIFNTLTGKEIDILRYRFYEGLTLEEIGKKTNLNSEKVYIVLENSLKKLREPEVIKQMKVINYTDYALALDMIEKQLKEIAFLKNIISNFQTSNKNMEKEIDDILVEELNLSRRTRFPLLQNGIHSVGDIRPYLKSLKGLKAIVGIGKISEREILDELDRIGFKK